MILLPEIATSIASSSCISSEEKLTEFVDKTWGVPAKNTEFKTSGEAIRESFVSVLFELIINYSHF